MKPQTLLSRSLSLLSDNENTLHTRTLGTVGRANVANAILAGATAAGGGTPLSWGPAGLQVLFGTVRTFDALTGNDSSERLAAIRGGLTQVALGLAGFVPVVGGVVNAVAAGVDALQAGQYYMQTSESNSEESNSEKKGHQLSDLVGR